MKKLSRSIAGAGLAMAMTLQPVLAEDYPTRSVEFIVPWNPGGGSDILMRIVANNISPYLGADMSEINIGDVGGTVGLAEAANRAADGYTISQIHEGLLTAAAVGMIDLAWDDFEPISLMKASSLYLVAATDQPFDTFEGMVEYAQANPNALTIGVTLSGVPHLHAAMIAEAFDIEWRYIGYEGTGWRIRSVVGGNLDVAIGDVSSSLQFAENGDFIFLASGTKERGAQTPDVLTLTELGADLELLITRGIVMPKDAPEEVQAILEAALGELSHQNTHTKDQT